jgi:glycosyltransferase involved in cell wall biosynthesis
MIKLNPLISVIIPTYKRNDFLKRAIESVLNQSYINLEVIVVDDNDPDTFHRKQTEKKINELRKKYNNNIIHIKHDKNKGASAARNTGIFYAKGEYIAFLDDDDYWVPDKIEVQLKYINDYDIILSLGNYINSNFKFKNFDKKEITSNDLKKRNCGGGSTSSLLIKKDIVKNYLFDTSLYKSQDWDLYIRLSQKYKIKNIKKPLTVIDFNINRERISTNKLNQPIDYFKRYHLFFDKHKHFFGRKMYNYHLARLYLDGFGLRKDKMSYFIDVIRLHGLYYPIKILFDKIIRRL